MAVAAAAEPIAMRIFCSRSFMFCFMNAPVPKDDIFHRITRQAAAGVQNIIRQLWIGEISNSLAAGGGKALAGFIRQKIIEMPQRERKFVAAGCEAETEMRRHAETVAGRHQYAALRKPATEFPRIGAVGQPWKRSHAAAGSNPAQNVGVFRENLIEKSEVALRHSPRAAVDGLAVLEREHSETLAHSGIRDGEVAAHVQIALAPLRVTLDDPADAQPTQAESLRKIAEHRRVRKSRRGSQFGAVIDRMIDLVGDKLN